MVMSNHSSFPERTPQSSFLSLLLFNVYLMLLWEMIKWHSLQSHQYANGSQLYIYIQFTSLQSYSWHLIYPSTHCMLELGAEAIYLAIIMYSKRIIENKNGRSPKFILFPLSSDYFSLSILQLQNISFFLSVPAGIISPTPAVQTQYLFFFLFFSSITSNRPTQPCLTFVRYGLSLCRTNRLISYFMDSRTSIGQKHPRMHCIFLTPGNYLRYIDYSQARPSDSVRFVNNLFCRT